MVKNPVLAMVQGRVLEEQVLKYRRRLISNPKKWIMTKSPAHITIRIISKQKTIKRRWSAVSRMILVTVVTSKMLKMEELRRRVKTRKTRLTKIDNSWQRRLKNSILSRIMLS
jgi:hypothetical protein